MAVAQSNNDGELLAMLQRTWESAPPEVKAAFPNFLTAGGNLLNAWALHEDTIVPVNNVIHFLNPDHDCSLQAAKFYVEQANNNTGVLTHSEVLVHSMSSNTPVPGHVAADIVDGLQRSAKTLLISSTIYASFQVVLSLASLWELHESVKGARNLTKSSIDKLETISKKLRLVPGKVAELDRILTELTQQDIAMVRVTRLSNKSNRIKKGIDSQLNSIMREIDNLEVEINSNKVRLGAARKQAYLAGVGSIANAVTSVISVGLLHGVATPYVSGIAKVVAACNVLLGLDCPMYAYVTEKELNEIQVRLDEISKMKAEVEELEMKLTEQVDLIYDRIDELTAEPN